MRIIYIAATLMLVVTTCACAKQGPESSEVSVSGGHAVVLGPVHTDGKCHFRFPEVPDQGYSDGMYRFSSTPKMIVGWAFGLGCKEGASQNDVYGQIGAKPANGKWIDLNFGEPFKPKQNFKLIKFSGKNWKGIATAVDQIYYAPPDQRSRFFNFCLVENNGPQVLCGRTQVRGVTDPPSTSKLPKIMAVLKTIVFVDTPDASPTPSVTTNKP